MVAAPMQLLRAEVRRQLGRSNLKRFTMHTYPEYSVTWFHEILLDKLDRFAKGEIKKLMIFMPPQHGKSELVSRRLPAYMLGINPNLRIAGASYVANLARSFNRSIQRIMDSEEYLDLFPNTRLNSKNAVFSAAESRIRTADKFEIVGHSGFYKSVGVGGELTGTSVDIGIIDDPVKDALQADSPTYRARLWEWYDQVFCTRLHNDSQQLITLTRWHRDDLAGQILKAPGAEEWDVLKLPAIFQGVRHHPLDRRKEGEALWPEKHAANKIMRSNARTFAALYQQEPAPPKGGLVFSDFRFCEGIPEGAKKRALGLDFGYANDPTAAI